MFPAIRGIHFLNSYIHPLFMYENLKKLKSCLCYNKGQRGRYFTISSMISNILFFTL
jgi:hypothetical protein